jgi:hypothetical protein
MKSPPISYRQATTTSVKRQNFACLLLLTTIHIVRHEGGCSVLCLLKVSHREVRDALPRLHVTDDLPVRRRGCCCGSGFAEGSKREANIPPNTNDLTATTSPYT